MMEELVNNLFKLCKVSFNYKANDSRNKARVGIWFYNTEQYLDDETGYTYSDKRHFRVKINCSTTFKERSLNDRLNQTFYEDSCFLEGIFFFKISDYEYLEERSQKYKERMRGLHSDEEMWKLHTAPRKVFNFKQFIMDFFSEKDISYVISRMNKLKAFRAGKPITKLDTDFIEFDDTADNMSGPEELNGKFGASISLTKDGDASPKQIDKILRSFNFISRMSRLDIPWIAKRRLGKAMGDTNDFENAFYKLTKSEKQKTLLSLSYEEFIELYRKTVKRLAGDESIFNLYPYHIYLAGNDDTSYSKYFLTIEEALEEARYLIAMQPINFWDDVKNRGYIFTN